MNAKLCLCCLLVAGSAAAQTQATVPIATPAQPQARTYTVVAGDTCIGIARKLWGDAGKVKLLHTYNTLGPSPHHLVPGQVLIISPGALPVRLAEVSLVVNHVLAFTPEQHPGHVGDPLRGGDRVSTGERSIAELTFADLAKLRLGGNSLMVVSTQPAAGPSDAPQLMRGALRAFVSEVGARREQTVNTGGAGLRLGGGEAGVRVNARDATSLSVFRGRSRIRSAKREVPVDEGYGTRAEKGKAPEKPRPLPATPTWDAGEELAVWLPEGQPAKATLAVHVPPEEKARVVSFHAEFAADAAGKDLRDEQTISIATPIELTIAEEGEQFVRVSAIDAADLESRQSRPLRVVAAPAPTASRGTDGATRLALPRRAQCRLDGELVTGEARLEPTHAHELVCVLTNGAGGAFPPLNYAAAERAPSPPSAAPPTASPPPPRAAIAPPRRWRPFALAGGGIRIEPSRGRVAGFARLGAEALRAFEGAGALGIGGRFAVDVDRGEGGAARADTFELGLLPSLTYYARPLDRRVEPFLGLAGGAVLKHAPRVGWSAYSVHPTVEVQLGLDLALGRPRSLTGWLRLSAGYRRVFLERDVDSPTSGFLLGAELGLR